MNGVIRSFAALAFAFFCLLLMGLVFKALFTNIDESELLNEAMNRWQQVGAGKQLAAKRSAPLLIKVGALGIALCLVVVGLALR
jgi:hypothetical protein